MQTLGFKRNKSNDATETPISSKDEKEKPDKPEKLKRPRGRPRIHPLPATNVATGLPPVPGGLLYLPNPPNRNLRSAPAKFFAYWNGLTPEMKEHVEVRVYRMWPAIDRTLSGESKKDIAIVKTENPFGKDWMKGILDHFGSGDYNLYMVESPGGAQVCMTFVSTVRDYNQYPPVLNKQELMVTDPTNASYISWLKNHNQFDPTGDDKRQDEKDNEEMAAIDKLADTVIELSKQNQQQRPAQAPAMTIQPMQRDSESAIKLVTDAANTAIRMTESAANKMSDAKTNGADPLQQVDALVKLSTVMRGNDDSLKVFLERESERNARLEERNQALLAQLMQPTAPPPPAKTLVEQLREINEIEELLGRGKRKRPADSDDEEDEKKKGDAGSLMGLLMQNLPVVAPMVQGIFTAVLYYGANAVHNSAVLKTGAGTPQAPAPPEVITPAPAIAQTAPQSQMTAAMQGQAVPPYELTEEQKPFAPYHPFVANLQPSLIKHLNDESLGGIAFAQWLIDSATDGRLQYDQLKQAGKDNLMALLKSYPPLWNIIGVAEPRVSRMIDEFLAYDDADEETEGENA